MRYADKRQHTKSKEQAIRQIAKVLARMEIKYQAEAWAKEKAKKVQDKADRGLKISIH